MSELLAVGVVVDGRYEIIDVLGRGGCGVVYRGRQRSTGQDVAIKVLSASRVASYDAQNERARFEREMSTIAHLQHPNIVRLIDSGTLSDGEHYMVLEFIRGKHLQEYTREKGKLGVAETMHLMSQVLDALACAHEQGVVHRDMKPTNVMVTTSGARRNAIVLDFGVAGIIESARSADYQALTMAGKFVGTPAYMAPEQIRGEELTPRTDLYGFALVFIECLTGNRAVPGTTNPEILTNQVSERPIPIPADLDRDLQVFLDRCAAKDPELRFANALHAMSAMAQLRVPSAQNNQPAIDAETVRVNPADIAAIDFQTALSASASLNDMHADDGAATQAMVAISDAHPAIQAQQLAAAMGLEDEEENVRTEVVNVSDYLSMSHMSPAASVSPEDDGYETDQVGSLGQVDTRVAQKLAAAADSERQSTERLARAEARAAQMSQPTRKSGSMGIVIAVVLLLAAIAGAVVFFVL